MPYVVWSDMFKINVPYIDQQHKQLLEISNAFHAAVKSGSGRETLFETLNSLIRYAEKHFCDEEEMMRLTDYPTEDIDSHKRIHEQLVQDIFNLFQDFKDSKEKTVHELEVFFNSWLVQHILIEDKKIESYCSNLTDFQPAESKQ